MAVATAEKTGGIKIHQRGKGGHILSSMPSTNN
jgi:hypothetical protein